MRRLHAVLLVLPLLLLAGCGDREQVRLSSSHVAGAGDLRFSVEDAARLLAPSEELPADPEVVRALAEFWVDYALLALLMNEEGALDRLDLSVILDPQEKQSLVMRLREEVIDDNFEVDDAEVEAAYEADRPGEEVRARHILFAFPEGATAAQRDSLRALAEQVRGEAAAGANFANLAARWSGDPGSAEQGGDLGYFPRGIMVAPFEEAVFSLEPGEVSAVVETQFGFHVIRVEDRRVTPFEELREELRRQIAQERVMQAESIFVADAERDANIRIEDGAPGTMREVAAEVENGVSRRLAGRTLARYEGGSFTGADFADFLTNQAPALIPQVETAADSDLRGLLENLLRSEVLVVEARRRGIQPDTAEARELREGLREQYRSLADMIGVTTVERASGESLRQAVERSIQAILIDVVRGDADVFPLQQLALPLRARYGYAISEAGVERTRARVEELRAEGYRGEPGETGPSEPDDGTDDGTED
jgi:hypothetical protein